MRTHQGASRGKVDGGKVWESNPLSKYIKTILEGIFLLSQNVSLNQNIQIRREKRTYENKKIILGKEVPFLKK